MALSPHTKTTWKIALALFIVGALLMSAPHATWFETGTFLTIPRDTLARVIEELGGAFVIAALLAVTVDQVFVTRLTREVAHGVEAYYLTYNLPEEFAEEVMYVRDVRSVRKNYTIRCWFREADADHISAEFIVSYTVVNFSSDNVTVTQRMQIEEIDADPRRHQIARVSHTGADLTHQHVVDVAGTRYEERVVVAPNAKDPRNNFDHFVRKTFPRSYYSETFIFNEPVLNVRVVLEEIPEDFIFEVTIGHRSAEKVTALPSDNPRSWSLDRAFFPGSGVLLEWKPKPKPPAQITLEALVEDVDSAARS